jgi:protein-tyrosine phosphatase
VLAGERDLDWEGLFNARDLGGLPLASGGTTRFGSLVRADGLQRLTPAGWGALHGHGVRTCVDLRSSWEVSEHPYAPPRSDVVRVAAPWEEGLLDDPEFGDWATSGVLGCALYFGPFLERFPERTAEVVRVIAEAPAGALVFHCERGRDRTGLLALLLLSLAGVPDDVIIADHLATDARLIATGIARGHVPLVGEAELYAERGTTAEATVGDLLAGFDAASYLLDAGLSPDDLAVVRARLVDAVEIPGQRRYFGRL